MQEKIMQFKLPPEFFVKVLKDYSDWRFAWIREVLQNSIDACNERYCQEIARTVNEEIIPYNIDLTLDFDRNTLTILPKHLGYWYR